MNEIKIPKVSVIIPVYNAEKYLRNCLDSVVSQTLRDIEIICVDDGSTDNSLAILREYEKNDARVAVLHQSNINAGAARNNGFARATGEYLAFLDADDFFKSDMLEKAYISAKSRAAEILVFRSDAFDMDSGSFMEQKFTVRERLLPEHRPFAGTDIKRDFFKVFVGWTWDKLFLRSYVLENGLCFQEQRTTNDLYFTFVALAKSKRIMVLEDVLAHHRVHVKTSLEATRKDSWDCFYKALLALRDSLKDAGLYEHYEQDYINYCVHFSLWNLNTLAEPAREMLFTRLKEDWFRELGAADYPANRFYHPDEYLQFRLIMAFPYNHAEQNLYRLVRFTKSFIKGLIRRRR